MNTKDVTKGAVQSRRQPLITALEPRILLDGAAVATAVDLVTDVDHQDAASHSQAPEQSVHFTALAPTQIKAGDPSQNNGRREVAFVDTGVEDYQALVDGIGDGIEVRLLDAGQDGLAQLTAWAQQHDGYDAIYLLSHGAEGQLQLGSLTLDGAVAENRAGELATLGRALTADGDLLLYGCSVASGEGEAFVAQLASLTGADVAASDDATGAATLGGDWDLEVSRGTIDTAGAGSGLAEGFAGLLGPVAGTIDWTDKTLSQTYAQDPTVTNIGGSGLNLSVNTTGGSGASIQLAAGGSFGDAVSTGGDTTLMIGVASGSLTLIDDIRFTSSDGAEFKLNQFVLGWDQAGNSVFTITGWRDGVQVATATHDTTSPRDAGTSNNGNATVSFSTNPDFANIDEFRITNSIAANMFPNGVASTAFDDIVIAAAEVTNATPSVAVADSNLSYTEGDSAVQIDAAATVSDADGDAEWNGGSLSLQITGNAEAGDRLSILDNDGDGTAITVSGTDIFANGVDIGDLSASGGSVTGGTALTITFDTDATNASVQEVLQSLRYESTTNDPGTSNRTITVTATDSNGASGNDTRTVVMTAVNDEPTATATAGNPTFTEGGNAAGLFSNTSIDTIESGQTIKGLTLTVTNVADGSNEVLNLDGSAIALVNGSGITIGNGLSYTVSVTNGTATVTVSGATLSAAGAQSLIDGISYQNNSDTPTTSNRVVTLTGLSDSGGTTNGGDDTVALAIASTVTVVQTNDAPTLTVTGSNPSFTEGGSAAGLFSGSSISTIESGQTLTGLTLTVSNVTDGSNEVLNLDGSAITLTDGTSGTTTNSLSYQVSVANGTATVTVTGATLSTADAQALIDGLSYQNNGTAVSGGDRVVTLTGLSDSGGVANGGTDTASLSLASTVTVVGINDEPTLTATASNPTFTEGGNAAGLFSNTSVNTIEAGQTVSGLTLTVSNVADGSSEVLNLDGSAIALVDGSGITIGNGLSYSVSVADGTATVTVSGATLSSAGAQALINGLSYQNNSDTPSTTSNRVVTLTSLTDSGGTTNGGDDTVALAIASTVSLVQTNDAPTLTATGSNPTFTEGGSTAGLFSGTSISTIESGQTLTGLTLTVSNVTDGSNEVLNLDGRAISLTDGTSGTTTNSLSYQVSVANGTATVTVTGATLSTAGAQALIDGLSYQNNGTAVSGGDRVVTLTGLSDSGGVANGGTDTASLSVASTVTVVAINDEPTATATASNPTFIEGGNASGLFSNTSIDTIEATQTVSGLTLTVTNVADGSNEVLNLDGSAIALTDGTSGITIGNGLSYSVSVADGTATVTVSGATLSSAGAQALINGLSYQNNSDTPTTSNRVVTLTGLSDSGGTTNGGDDTVALAIASTVTLVQNNDAPTLTVTGSNPSFTEGGSAAGLFSGSSIDTIESGQTLTGLTLTVSNVTDGSNEVLSLDGSAITLTDNASGITIGNGLSYSVSVANGTATVTVSGGTLSVAGAQTLIDGLSYQNNGTAVSGGDRVVTLTGLTDSGGTANGGTDTASLSLASTVTVVAINDEPTLTATASNPTFTEGGAAASLFSGTNINTVESGQSITGLSFTVTNVTNGSNERVNIDGSTIVLTHGTNGSTAGNSFNYSVMVIGTTATVTLTGGNLSAAATEAMLDGMSYQNNSNAPSTSNRVVTLTSLQDSGGTANGGDDTVALAIASTVTVVQSNDAPTLTANGSNPTFTEGGSAAGLFSGSSISTIEAGQTLTGLTLTVSNVANGSSEIINLDGTAIALTQGTNGSTAGNSLGYTVTVVGSTATVSLSGGTLSNATVQTLIDTMSYQNNSDAPSTSNRVVTLTGLTDSGGTANGGTDTASLSVASTVTVVGVNDAPVAVNDVAVSIEAGGTANGSAGSHESGNVLSNDTDVDAGDSKTVTAVRTGVEAGSGTGGTLGQALVGQYGSLTLNADGSYTYEIDENNATVQALRQSGQTLSETFTYRMRDTAGLTDSATLTITIEGRNDAPVAVNDTANAVEAGGIANGTAGSGASGNVLSNDTDVDGGDSKRVTAIRTGAESGTGTSGTVGAVLAGRYGSLTLNADGTYSYVIDESNADVQALRQSGQTLSESFTYTVSDTDGLSDMAALTITIEGRNDAPVAVAGLSGEQSGLGAEYRLEVGRLFADADGAAYGERLTIVVEGLPQGLYYDAAQGLILGRTSEPGQFTIRLTAMDMAGLSVSRSFQLEILAPPGANNPVAPSVLALTPTLPPMRVESELVPPPSTAMPSGLVTRVGAQDNSGFVAPQRPVETVLLSRPGALVVKSAPVGGAATIRAEVAVNVGANGEVVFSELQQQAFDAVAMSVAGIRLNDGLFTVTIADGQSLPGQRYTGMQPNGEALPPWITVDPRSGEIRVRPEAATGVLNIRIQTQGENGEVRILDLQLDVQTLLRQQGGDTTAVLDGGFVPLAEQLAAELDATQGYGQRLLSLLESA